MIGRCHVQHCIDVFMLTIDLPVADLNAGSILSPPSSRLTGLFTPRSPASRKKRIADPTKGAIITGE
jgi:hypothetical protein